MANIGLQSVKGPSGVGRTELEPGAIGLLGVVMQALTHVAPAAGAILTIQAIVLLVGPIAPLAFLIAGVIVVMLGISLTQLARHLPSAGGYYTYVTDTLGPRWGFLTAWAYFLYDPIQGGMNLAFAGWITNTVLNLYYGINVPWLWPAFVIVGSVGIALLMYTGIAITARVQVALGAFEILVMMALALTGFIHPGAGGASMAVFNPGNIVKGGNLFLAIVFSIFAYTGFEACVPLAEESKNPLKTIPTAIMASIVIGVLFYILVSWGVMSGWGLAHSDTLASSVNNPVVVVTKQLWGGFSILLVIVYINSVLGAVFAGNNATTRVYFGMARNHALPRVLSEVGKRHRTPNNAITLQAGLSLLIGLGASLIFGPDKQLFVIATVITLSLILVYIAGNIGVIKYYLTVHRDEFNWFLHLAMPIVSSIALLIVFYYSVVPLPAYPVVLAPFIVGIWLLIGVGIIFGVRRWGHADWLDKVGSAMVAEVDASTFEEVPIGSEREPLS
jgi:amino acid transporter